MNTSGDERLVNQKCRSSMHPLLFLMSCRWFMHKALLSYQVLKFFSSRHCFCFELSADMVHLGDVDSKELYWTTALLFCQLARGNPKYQSRTMQPILMHYSKFLDRQYYLQQQRGQQQQQWPQMFKCHQLWVIVSTHCRMNRLINDCTSGAIRQYLTCMICFGTKWWWRHTPPPPQKKPLSRQAVGRKESNYRATTDHMSPLCWALFLFVSLLSIATFIFMRECR